MASLLQKYKELTSWEKVGAIGSVASVIGIPLSVYFYLSSSPQPQAHQTTQTTTQIGGDSGTQIGSVQGNVTINSTPALPLTTPTQRNPVDRARSELQQLSVSWSSESFVDAVVGGDVRAAALFLQGGMKPDLNYKGASAAVYILQPMANNREEMLKLFLRSGLKPNTYLLDARIMRTYGSLPPHFQDKLAPAEYGAWKKQFAGPPDLWIVIRASYSGPSKDDFALLKALAASGAKFDVSLAFLREYENIYGGTPVYWQVRNEVETLAKAPVTPRPTH